MYKCQKKKLTNYQNVLTGKYFLKVVFKFQLLYKFFTKRNL